MKLKLVELHQNGLLVFRREEDKVWDDEKVVGYADLPVEVPKKMVVKEAVYLGKALFDDKGTTQYIYVEKMPDDAKNIKVTYEIEE